MEDNCRPLVQEHAIQVGLEMFGKLAQRCTVLLEEHLATGNCFIFNEDLHQVAPGIKVWCDWMTCHAELWNPAPLPRAPDLGPSVDVWQNIADLCNVLKNVDINHVKLYRQKKEGCELVVLEEDAMLSGFVPLLSLPQTSVYVHCTVDKVSAWVSA
ncbi:hypothetical protein NP493_577g02005 [Ridgeia piscesae]|uniref:DNA/RNA-binding domain-containing protein n=1 Tax=Ridgeia piscesae TaxID=27915 RepID=A0AAD9NPC1_RIDPI|nr:hypothetical protein NP493_577g02005 [Ridgeia piscesae]